MSSLGRSSAVIAAGTLASRATGLLRNVVLVTAIGAIGRASDAFTIANQVPNYVFQVISAGLLTAVIVPQIVAWSQQDDGGRAHISKLFTLGTVLLLGVTTLAMVAAPLLVRLFASQFSAEQHALSVAFAYWCLPQVFFYGMFALVGETLNARRVFGPYAWAPIVNNIVSIAGFLVFIALFGSERSGLEGWDPGMIALIAGTATLGILAQTVALVLFWRRTGLRIRPDFRWRGMGLGRIRNLAGWSFAMLIVGLVVSIVQQSIISGASGDAATTVWFNAWLVFMFPYSVIVMSIGTPYFTQLSEHASAGRDTEVLADIGRSIRVLGLLCVIAVAAIAAAAVPATRVFTSSPDEAVAASPVLIGFLVGLVPLAVQFVVQRTFYAYGDTRTPFWFTVFQGVLAIGFAALAFALFSGDELRPYLTAAVATGQSISSLAQVVLASWLLRRRIGPLGMGSSLWALARFALAALPAAAAGYGVFVWSGGAAGWMTSDKLWGALGCVVIGGTCVIVYALVLALFRSPELKAVTGLVRRIIRR